ncbi:MAG TPA: hypothetical protein VF599_05320 [Pyrinomonadaceae bacterium]|jgi:hypothetical protein
MKTIALFLALVFCLGLAACSSGPVKEADELMKAKDEVILEMGKKIEANPTEAGVDEARKLFESKKGDLNAKSVAVREKITGAHGDLMTKLQGSVVSDGEGFNNIRKKVVTNDAANKKFLALQKDFEETTAYFKVSGK